MCASGNTDKNHQIDYLYLFSNYTPLAHTLFKLVKDDIFISIIIIFLLRQLFHYNILHQIVAYWNGSCVGASVNFVHGVNDVISCNVYLDIFCHLQIYLSEASSNFQWLQLKHFNFLFYLYAVFFKYTSLLLLFLKVFSHYFSKFD